MSTSKGRKIYQVLRTVIITSILTVVGIYVLLYVGLSLPCVQDKIRVAAENQLSDFFGTHVTIGKLGIEPFNSVTLEDVTIPDRSGNKCIDIGKIAAGIDIFDLVFNHHITITYGELIDLDAAITQAQPDEPMNIQFIIDAFKPKDHNKPPTKFNLVLQSVVIRNSHITFDKQWIPRKKDPGTIDFNHLDVSNFRADIKIPVLKNDHYVINLSRLSLTEKSGLEIKKLSLNAEITPGRITLHDISIEFPNSTITPNNFTFYTDGIGKTKDLFPPEGMHLTLKKNVVNPSDFAPLWRPLANIDRQFTVTLDAKGKPDELNIYGLAIFDRQEELQLKLDKTIILLPNEKHPFAASIDGIFLKADFKSLIPFMKAAGTNPQIIDAAEKLDYLTLKGKGKHEARNTLFDGKIQTGRGNLNLRANYSVTDKGYKAIAANFATEMFDASELIPNVKLKQFSGKVSTKLTIGNDVKIDYPNLPDINGTLCADIPLVRYDNIDLTNIVVDIEKSGNHADIFADIDDPNLGLYIDAKLDNGVVDTDIALHDFHPGMFGIGNFSPDDDFSVELTTNLAGTSLDNLIGNVNIYNLSANVNNKPYNLEYLNIENSIDDDINNLSVSCEFGNLNLSGKYSITQLPKMVMSTIAEIAPSWINYNDLSPEEPMYADLDIYIPKDSKIFNMVSLPVTLLEDLAIHGHADNFSGGLITLNTDIPWLQQGKDKLITNTKLDIALHERDKRGNVSFTTTMPVKKGEMTLNVDAKCRDNHIKSSIGWDFHKKGYLGRIDFDASAEKMQIHDGSSQTYYTVEVQPSNFTVNDTVWHVNESTLTYGNKKFTVDNLEIGKLNQSARIHGTASADPDDMLNIDLHNINLDYIFETLAINNVSFGGVATGNVKASNVLTAHPMAFTDNLFVKDFKYNGAMFGDAQITSKWDNDAKAVAIGADIRENGRRTATVDGAIWVTRDSLSFDFDADKVTAKFLAPFFQEFAHDIGGRASGKVKLFGTFSDVNLTGNAYAHDLSLRVNYTNVLYHVSDSVILKPNRIIIPGACVYDQEGHSGYLAGEVKHRYFHDVSFDFNIRDCHDLLTFNTNSKMNPIWYGTIYSSGGGNIKGWPGYIGITVDMTTAPKSEFNLILSDAEVAEENKFLTFSDRRKASTVVETPDTVPDFVKAFQKKVKREAENQASVIDLDLRGTVLPNAKLNLVMDPVSGDKISCAGQGSIQAGYNSSSEEFTMKGKYTIDEGNYNFTLQDIILKDFTIKPGSNIMFEGDPMNAVLDIDAIYRVNTSLADLDKSFATDRELNRTNVQVDAVLKVDGPLTHPDISFDIDFPTLKADLASKVKSIISTDDMLNRQIIYLLALNRFYTPEYMGLGSTGAEWSSLASSTISSQISNIMDNLSDKWSFNPSFHTDKGDFSDIEFDLALSSRLLNNRLLFNGNFGYRDKTTSNTTFIGDFDLEYLLTNTGNLRLKAYNHFNDQNYYLKSSLTTQGLGIVYKRDFNGFSDLIPFRRRKTPEPADSISSPNQ